MWFKAICARSSAEGNSANTPSVGDGNRNLYQRVSGVNPTTPQSLSPHQLRLLSTIGAMSTSRGTFFWAFGGSVPA